MIDDVEMFFDKSDSKSYIESLSKARMYLPENFLAKLDEVIMGELELALLDIEKAKSEILKSNKKENITPLKGA